MGVLALEVLERVEVPGRGKPASAPAMSNPTTPESRQATDSSAISRDRAWWRIAVSSWRTTILPSASTMPASKPDRTAPTTWSRVRPLLTCCSGA